jgi:hypothetical protein
MEEKNVYDEFEVSFDYKKVLYICQVKLMKEPNTDSYFVVEYFSPNEKGNISKLEAKPGKDGSEKTEWFEAGKEHEHDFLQTLGAKIEEREM